MKKINSDENCDMESLLLFESESECDLNDDDEIEDATFLERHIRDLESEDDDDCDENCEDLHFDVNYGSIHYGLYNNDQINSTVTKTKASLLSLAGPSTSDLGFGHRIDTNADLEVEVPLSTNNLSCEITNGNVAKRRCVGRPKNLPTPKLKSKIKM